MKDHEDDFYEKSYAMPHGYKVTMRWGRSSSPTETWEPRAMPEHIRSSPEMGDALGITRAAFKADAVVAAHGHDFTSVYMPAEDNPTLQYVFHRRAGKSTAKASTGVTSHQVIGAPQDMRVRKNREAVFGYIWQHYLEANQQKIKVIVTKPKFVNWLQKRGLPNNVILENFDVALGSDGLTEMIRRCEQDLSIWRLVVV